ncbi:CDK5 regulatory subunit-associated protein 3 isoform X1 [Chelonia mydas]|uniref:CDK5 regulatory subunit-associated protein 3 isoform X1 n=1 Tax=Chelonia mydas TaxID=8469 RepID=UPI001CA9AB99|nr:CDK5 regulatory subunit-associated protein 3 isoform X1 [Chelonia mydas]
MQDYQNLPIDIQTSKLLDWLVDRRHCNLKWQSHVLTIREKINVAIQDMPESEEIKQLLSGSYIHYFHCLRIVEILKGTEASTKNIFGRYSSQRMKDWQEILSLYEKENTYLVELASLLLRSVSYEIPSLKKQISKCQQLQQEYSRKEEECQLGAAEMRERFYASCKQYGITGDNVRRELLALVKDLPALLTEIGAGARVLSEAIDSYQACVQFVCESSPEQVVPLLRHVQERGNTTVYEWRKGVEPTTVERPRAEEVPEKQDEEAIDWGDLGVESTPAPVGVDYSISGEDGTQAEEVDWGISLEPDPQGAGTDGIDWGDGSGGDPVQITVLEAGIQVPDGVARGPDALTLLENPETRSQFIDELMELETFLSQRIVEMSEEADVVSVSQFQLAPPILQGQTAEKVGAMAAAVRELIGRLINLRMQHLFLILASPRCVGAPSSLPACAVGGRARSFLWGWGGLSSREGTLGSGGQSEASSGVAFAQAAPWGGGTVVLVALKGRVLMAHLGLVGQVCGPCERAPAPEAEAGGAAGAEEGAHGAEEAGGAGGAGCPRAQARPAGAQNQGAAETD